MQHAKSSTPGKEQALPADKGTPPLSFPGQSAGEGPAPWPDGQPPGGQPTGGQPQSDQPQGGQPTGSQPQSGQPQGGQLPGSRPDLRTRRVPGQPADRHPADRQPRIASRRTASRRTPAGGPPARGPRQVRQPGRPVAPGAQQRALVAMILGLLAIFGLFSVSDLIGLGDLRRSILLVVFSFLIGAVALWLGVSAVVRSRRTATGRPRGSVSAIILGSIGILFSGSAADHFRRAVEAVLRLLPVHAGCQYAGRAAYLPGPAQAVGAYGDQQAPHISLRPRRAHLATAAQTARDRIPGRRARRRSPLHRPTDPGRSCARRRLRLPSATRRAKPPGNVGASAWAAARLPASRRSDSQFTTPAVTAAATPTSRMDTAATCQPDGPTTESRPSPSGPPANAARAPVTQPASAPEANPHSGAASTATVGAARAIRNPPNAPARYGRASTATDSQAGSALCTPAGSAASIGKAGSDPGLSQSGPRPFRPRTRTRDPA